MNGSNKYYGAYTAQVTETYTNGRVGVNVDGIGGAKNLVAQISQLASAGGGSSGARYYPPVGTQCYVVFQQGMQTSPIIIGYLDPKVTGKVGDAEDGDFLFKNNNRIFGLYKDRIELRDSANRGLVVRETELHLVGKYAHIKSRPDATRVKMHSYNAYHDNEESVEQYQNLSTAVKEYTFDAETMKVNVTGDYEIKALNNLSINSSAFNVTASEEILFSARNEIGMLTDNFTVTAGSDIFMGATLGNIRFAALAGNVTMAAGAVATADTGITVYAAKVETLLDGTIIIDNNTSQTEYSITGKIEERALLGRSNTYGPEGVSTDSAGNISYSTALKYELVTGLGVSITTATTVDMTAIAGFNLTTPAAITTQSNIYSISSPLISVSTVLPINGLVVPTLLGLSKIFPG